MMKSRRRAGWLVAGMLGTSVLVMPLEGEAAIRRWREPPVEGDPDQPNGGTMRIGFTVQFEARLIFVTPGSKNITVAKSTARNSTRTRRQ